MLKGNANTVQLYVTTVKEKPCFSATTRWLMIPFSERLKNPFDIIIDVLTVIPVFLEKANSLQAEHVLISTA